MIATSTPVMALFVLNATLPSAAPGGEPFTHPLGFVLAESTVYEVQEAFGPAPVVDAEKNHHAVCYVVSAANTLLSFTSPKEGIHVSFAGRFAMSRLSGSAPRECRPLAAVTGVQPSLSVAGLRLGMSKKEYRTVLGDAVAMDDGMLGAAFYRRADNGVHVLVTVAARFAGDSLVELKIAKEIST